MLPPSAACTTGLKGLDGCTLPMTGRHSAVLPAAEHVIGKTDTHTIGRNNANRRHYMARMTRRGKDCFQKSHHG